MGMERVSAIEGDPDHPHEKYIYFLFTLLTDAVTIQVKRVSHIILLAVDQDGLRA